MGVIRAAARTRQRLGGQSVGAAWRASTCSSTTYAALLVAVGLVMAYTNSIEAGSLPFEAGTTFSRGLMWAVIAVVVYVLATAFDYRWLRTLAWPIYALQLGLLVLTLAIGSGVGEHLAMGHRRAPDLPVQRDRQDPDDRRPGRLSLGEARPPRLAAFADRRLPAGRSAPRPGHAPARPRYLARLRRDPRWDALDVGCQPALAGRAGRGVVAMVPIAWTYLLRDYQKARLEAFLNATPDIQGAGFQLHQAQIAVGSGGLVGKGLTNGTQTQGEFLPVQATDFVFATLAEELGFIGGIVLFVLFVLLLWRVLVAGWRSRDGFGTLFAAGVASMILFQLVVNVGMVLGVMPITGIPLPFVTHGGASLVSMAAGLGILQSINIRQTRAAW